MIVTVGGMSGGFALLVQNGKPTFIYNWLALERYTPVSPTYEVPFKFTGNIKLVTVESQPPNLSPEHEKNLHGTRLAHTTRRVAHI